MIIDDRVFNKIYTAVSSFLDDVGHNPDHEIRDSVDVRVVAFAERLRADPELLAKGEAFKEEILDHPEVRRWIDSLWIEAKRGMISAANDPASELRVRLVTSLQQLGARLAEDPALQAKVDRWVSDALAYVVENSDMKVFVVGDLAHSLDAEGAPLPGMAPVAIQQGRFVARHAHYDSMPPGHRTPCVGTESAGRSWPFPWSHPA